KFDRSSAPNPLVGNYRTKDDRYVTVMMLTSDKFWPEFARLVGLGELVDDDRFKDAGARFTNRVELIKILDDRFASQTLDEWKVSFAPLTGAWAPMQTAVELHDDPDIVANGYIANVTASTGAQFAVRSKPVQFEETQDAVPCAPEKRQYIQ